MRRRTEITPRDRPKIRSSSVRGFNGFRSNVEIQDVIRPKRVKFMDPESDCQLNTRPSEPAVLFEPTRDPASNGPKTSEFAFFKKLKEDAGCSRSCTSKNEENQLKKFEPSVCSRGISEKFKDIRDNSKSTFLVENVRPITHSLFLSPVADASTNSEAANIVDEDRHKAIMSPLFFEKVKPTDNSLLFSPLGGASKTSGTERLDGVFSVKRKRLHQWVANTSLPRAEGCDLVSMLIKRLFPDTAENNSCRDEKPMQMRADTKFLSHAFPELDTSDEDWTRRRDLLKSEYGCYSEDVCNRSLEIVPSKWDTEGSDSPLNSYATISHFQFGNRKFRANNEGGTPSLIAIQDPFFCSNVENYESTASRHIKDLIDFQVLDESVNGREPSTLSLDWDSGSFEDQGVLSITNWYAEMNSAMAASWDDHQQSLDNSSSASELDTSSFLFSYPSQLTSLPHPHSAPFSNGNEEKFLLAELKHFPLSLPSTPTYRKLKECDTYNTCDGSGTFSPQYHDWDISKVFSGMHRPDMEAFLFPSGLGFDFGWRQLSIRGSFRELYSPCYDGSQSLSKESPGSYLLTEEQHEDCFYGSNHRQNIPQFSEDTHDNHEWSSTNLWIPIDQDMTTPFLLDSSCWLRTEEDIY